MEENKEEIEELEPVEELEKTEEVKEEIKPVEEVKVEDTPIEEVKTEPMVEEKNKKKKGKGILIAIILVLLIVGGVVAAFFLLPKNETKSSKNGSNNYKSAYRMSGNGLEDFDLQFLKLENGNKNTIYSPLSIKYALAMLKEGSNGDSRSQIEAVIGDYKSNKYTNSEHMSFANAMFIRNSFKDNIRKTYTDNLNKKYNAEVIYDNFDNADNMNKWVSDKTFKLIDDLFDSNKVKDEDFILTNALAIDMNWNNQIQCATGSDVPCINYHVSYRHERVKNIDGYTSSVSRIYTPSGYYPLTFNGKENIKSAELKASFNRYDVLKEIGEDKIRSEVGEAYKKWLNTDEGKNLTSETNGMFPKDVDKYLDQYIKEISENYKKEATSTDFMLYNDENVKVFAKDLKEYDGTTLQYVGIMPVKEELGKYVEEVNAKDINNIISNLKEMKAESFKDGVVTLIKAHIPLFKYDYNIDLIKDLNKLGIKDVFDVSKADLSSMLTDGNNGYISDATHKANIEFSNDGIKAAAATQEGGDGATSAGFDYFYEIPYEEIDLTFDKPYMYLIRDKKTGEVWFAGTVYDPIERETAKIPDQNYDFGW